MSLSALFSEIFWTAVFCIPIAISLWALLDCARRPAWAWGLSGRSRVVWLFAICAGILSVVAGLLISGYYLVRVRPQIAAVEGGHIPNL